MKNKLKRIFELIFAFMIVFQNFCYADLISPGEVFHEYDDSEKISAFIKNTAISQKIIFVVLLCIFLVSGIMLLRTRNVNENDEEKNDESKKKKIVNKVFLGINVLINIFFMILARRCVIINIPYRGHALSSVIPMVNFKFAIYYLFYIAFILLLFSIIKVKKTIPKWFYIIFWIINIGLIIWSWNLIMNSNYGYYTYDPRLEFFK